MNTLVMNPRRRRIVKSAALMAGASFFTPSILAGINNAALGGTPRIGLIIGNGRYHDAPLINPVNDAKAIAVSLSGFGFNLKLLVDVDLKEMSEAVRIYTETVTEKQAVGIFYFAGHGVQLAWRNFLIPVDAKIIHPDDIPKRAFELNTLLRGLSKAENPMNVIILDACRDNPFGDRVLTEQKGLSQFDAPPRSLLAFATAPGNSASDGSGSNGLFTENLLREMRNPEAKIEDVFKRVRLSVRLQSNGKQVPWESTSLEDDFFFVPQAEKKKASRDERDARFIEERTIWETASVSSDPRLTEDYIRRYPNGVYSELAQARLDKLLIEMGEKRIKTVTSAANPFSKGSASGTGKYSVGDRFTYAEKDPVSGVVQRIFTEMVTSVTDFSTVFDNGNRILDLLGNETKSPVPRFITPAQFYPAEYLVGQKWNTKFGWVMGDGQRSHLEIYFSVVERKEIRFANRLFNAFVVKGKGYVIGGGAWTVDYKIDPDKCFRPIVFEMIGRRRIGGGYDTLSYRLELVEYMQRNVG